MRRSVSSAAEERPKPANTQDFYEKESMDLPAEEDLEEGEKEDLKKERERRPPEPGTPADRLQQVYLEYIRLLPPGKACTPRQWWDTPAKEEAVEKLYRATYAYCRKKIKARLTKGGLWPSELPTETVTVFQDAFLKIMADLCVHRKKQIPVCHYAGLATRLCRNQASDYLKLLHPGSKYEMGPRRRSDYNAPGEPAPGEEKKRGDPVQKIRLADPYIRDESGFQLDEGLFQSDEDNILNELEHRLELQCHDQVLLCYVRALLSYRGMAGKGLALCYGRILYQLTGRFDPEFGLPAAQRWDPRDRGRAQVRPPVREGQLKFPQPSDSCSAVWAMAHMKDKTLGTLCEESQQEFSWYFRMPVRWGWAFRRNLNKTVQLDGVSCRLAEVPYGRLYTLEQVRTWCGSVHPQMLSGAYKRIMKNETLSDYCCLNLPTSAKKFLDKGDNR